MLREVVGALVAHGGCVWAGIRFDEGGKPRRGPEAGEPAPDVRQQLPVVFKGVRAAELVVDGCDDRAFLERVATVISAYCLVGRDRGETSCADVS